MLLPLFLLAFLSARSQDLIVKTDQQEIKAKVIEIQENQIKYKKWDRLDGPLYNINKSEVFMIIYQSGDREFFNQQKPEETNTNSNVVANPSYSEQNQANNVFYSAKVATQQNTSTKNTSAVIYPTLGRINLGFGNNSSPDASTIALGVTSYIPFSSHTKGSLELEYGVCGIFSDVDNSFEQFSTSITTISLALNYGYMLTPDLKISNGLGYYYGFGTQTFDSSFASGETDISINDLYYNVTLDYLFTKGFGINIRYDQIIGFNFGISFGV